MTDTTWLNHVRNIYHLHRRIEEYSLGPQRQRSPRPWDTGFVSTSPRRSNRNPAAAEVATWVPRWVSASLGCCLLACPL